MLTPDRIFGERAPLDKRGHNPARIRPGLHEQHGSKGTYWVRCWVLVGVTEDVIAGIRWARGGVAIVPRPRYSLEVPPC